MDALFTSTSAVCVTGLTSVDTAIYSRFGQTVIMLLIQFGGLGLVTFATLYIAIPKRKVSLVNRGIIKEMFIDEVESNPKSIIRNIIVTTFTIEALGYLVLKYRFKALGFESYDFLGIFHSVSAFCNAGFSPFSNNLESFVGDWTVNLTIDALIIIGGIGFVVMKDINEVFMRTKRRLSYHSKIVLAMTGTLLLSGTAVFYIMEYDKAFASMAIPQKLLAAFFESVTTRTAGFDTIPQPLFSLPSVAFAIFLMFSGGSPGSTAGGVKTTTIFMVFASAFRGPEEDGSITYHGGALSQHSVAKAFSMIAKSAIIICSALMLVLLFEGGKSNFGDLLFEVVSAFGTVGLSRGVTQGLCDASKLVIISVMFMGRVGLFAMAITRSPDRLERFAEYPREDLLLG